MAGTKTWADGDVLTAADLNGYVRDQWITVCTSGTRPTTTQEGRTIYETDTDRHYVWDGAAWVNLAQTNAPFTYTPTLTASSSNPTLGAGSTISGQHWIVGKLCTVQVAIGTGAAGFAGGSGAWRVSIPVTAAAGSFTAFGSGRIVDTGVNVYALVPYISPGTAYMEFLTTVSPAGQMTNSSPFTIGQSDSLDAQITYRIA
jgi:hypothetical protein